MKVRDFEDKVWETEGVRLVVHAPNNTNVEKYGYTNGANERWSITRWCKHRIDTRLNGASYAVIQGDGEEPNGKVIMRTIRSSYKRKA